MTDLIADLETLDSHGRSTAFPDGSMRPAFQARPRRLVAPLWMLVASVLLVFVGAGWALRHRLFVAREQLPAVGGPPLSVAVLPFRNASGDQALDSLGSALSEVLRTELGQSSRVRTVPSGWLSQVLQDLRITPGTTLAPADLARVADFTSAKRIIWGQIAKFGTAIRIDATLQDLDHDESVLINATAPDAAGVLTAVTQLAETVRQNLARGSRGALNELQAAAWKPSTISVQALRLYGEGRELTQLGKHQDALKRFQSATEADPSFALAFSALAQSNATLGYGPSAVELSRRAVSLSDRLPPPEKFLIAAKHYEITHDMPKAIESYENLLTASPSDVTIQFDLGGLYEQTGAFDRARDHFAKAVELDPKFVEGLRALGRVEIKRGDAQGSLEPLNKALNLASALENDEALANTLQAIGVAYRRLGRREEALHEYEQSLAIKRKLGDKRGIAASLSEIASIHKLLGHAEAAEAGYRDAVAIRREIGDKVGMTTTLTNFGAFLNEAGRFNDALPVLREALALAREGADTYTEALALNNIGAALLAESQYSEAQTFFERALELREKAKVPSDMADTLHNLAETHSVIGHDDQSLTFWLRALDWRRKADDRLGIAVELHGIGATFDDQDRYGAATKSLEEALQVVRELKRRDEGFGYILSGYGHSLSLSGRLDEGAKPLEDALNVARELKNQSLLAEVLLHKAERLSYLGDAQAALAAADQASQAASRTPTRRLKLETQTAVAITTATVHPSRAFVAKLGSLAHEADTVGLKSLALECSLQRGTTLLQLDDRTGARQEAQHALAEAEALGRRLPLAKAHFLRAQVLRADGDAGAAREYAAALRLVEEIKGEEGNENVLKRADLSAMHAECVRWSKGA